MSLSKVRILYFVQNNDITKVFEIEDEKERGLIATYFLAYDPLSFKRLGDEDRKKLEEDIRKYWNLASVDTRPEDLRILLKILVASHPELSDIVNFVLSRLNEEKQEEKSIDVIRKQEDPLKRHKNQIRQRQFA